MKGVVVLNAKLKFPQDGKDDDVKPVAPPMNPVTLRRRADLEDEAFQRIIDHKPKSREVLK